MKKKLSLLMVALVAVAAFAGLRRTAEQVIYSWQDGTEAANKVTLAEGVTVEINGNTGKNVQNGNAITVNGTQYTTLKNSNGAQNTLTLSKKATAITFYSYVNKATAEATSDAYWKEVNGVSYTAETSGGKLACFSDGDKTNPDVRRFELAEPTNVITFNNAGYQLCYVIGVEYEEEEQGGGETGGEETWEVATSISVDDVVLFTYADGDVKKELKDIEMFGTNSVGATEDYTGDKPAGIYPLTVVAGSAEGSVAFKDANGKFLEWSSGNTMTLADAVTENSSWNVSFTEGVATVANVKDATRKLQYNSSNPRFCSYTSAQKAPILWKKVVAAPESPVKKVQIGGSFNNWDGATALTLTADAADANKFVGELDLTASKAQEAIKLVVNEANWLGATAVEVVAPEGWIAESSDAILLNNNATGFKTYTVTATWAGGNDAYAGWKLEFAGKDARYDIPADAVWSGIITDFKKDIVVDNAKLANLAAGDNIVVNFVDILRKDPTDQYPAWVAQMHVFIGDIEIGTYGVGESEAPVVKKIPVVGSQVKAIKENGLKLSGQQIAAYISIEKAAAPAGKSSVWIGEHATTDWGNGMQLDPPAFKYAPVQVGQTVTIKAHESVIAPRMKRALPEGQVVKIGNKSWADFDPVIRGTQVENGYAFVIPTEAIANDINENGFTINTAKAVVITEVDVAFVYSITVDQEIANGSVVANPATAEAGDEVTLTATPAEGYLLDKFVVTYNDGAEKTVTVTDGKFVMPAYNVNVTASFYKQPTNITVEAADITASINEAVAAKIAALPEGSVVGNITINLAAANYTLTAPIEAPANLTINGNGAIIDASALEGNMIEFAAKAAEDTKWTNADVAITAVTVKGLKKALFYSNSKYYYGNFTLANSVIEQAADATTFDYTKGSVALNFKIEGSTIYAPTATTKSLYSSQSGQKATEYNAEATQNFLFSLNTMYNLAPTKNFFTHRQNNQKWLSYTVQSNIFVNCGKSGQVIKGMNGGQGGANPTWTIKGNAFNFEAEGVMTDTSAAEETGDADHTQDETPGLNETVQNSVAGVVAFANAAEGDFTLGFDCAQYAAKIGDPRWLKENIGEAIVLNPETGADLYAALAAAMQTNPNPASITINLAENGAYTITNSLSASKSIIINGNGATVDASNCAVIAEATTPVPFIQMAALPAFGLNAKGAYEVDEVSFNNVKITGLKAQLFFANGQKYLIKKLAVDNSVIAIDGTAKKTIFDFAGRGNASEIIVNNSTLWANPSNAQNGGLHSSQSGDGAIQDLGSDKQLFAITNSTIYNIANGKTTCSQRRNNTAGMEFKVENSIIVNSGKSGQFIVGLNGGSANSAQTYTISNNSFNFEADGALTDVSAAEQTKVQEKIADKQLNSVAGVVEFANAAEGDFTLAAACAQNKAKIGDPRWLVAAPVEKLYIMGNGTPSGWDATTEMTFNEETQAFEFTMEVSGNGAWFTFGDAPFTSWDDFNANHRFAIGAGDVDATIGETLTLVQVNGTLAIKTAGKYLISVTKDLKMTITAKTDGISEVKANQNNAVIYNLNGVRVDKAQKGLYIVNGKKVVIK